MRKLAFAVAVGALAACSPPSAETPADETAAPPATPAVELGPYANSWDAAEFSRFRHTLNAETAGAHALTLTAQTDAPGGETVAVYPIGPDGQPVTARLIFVVADRDGTTGTQTVDIPAEGLPVEVVIENAGGRRHAGSYTLSIAAPTP